MCTDGIYKNNMKHDMATVYKQTDFSLILPYLSCNHGNCNQQRN